MASTPNKNRATSLNKSDQRSQKSSPKSSPKNPKPNKPKGSMGLGLLMIAIGTSLIGLGGLGYLVYQELLSSARREVDRSAEAQTRQIETKFADIRQSVDGVAGGARVLLQQQPKPKTAEPYQKLVVEAVQNAAPVAGMGIASNGALLFPPAKPLVPYVWKEKSGLKTEMFGQKLPIQNDKLLSGDRADIQKAPFYQETLKGKASWSQPYNALGKTIITYSAPISDGQKVVGIVSADAIANELLSVTAANPSAASESKIGFVVINASGKVITASDATQNPAITEALPSLAQQAQAQGIAQTGGNLWAYRKIAGSDWLVAAYLPESEITNKLLVLVGGVAVGISAILVIAILGFVNSLKKRLQPLSEECDRFLSQQGNAGANVEGKDEIDRLGLSLKNAFQQVKTNEIRLRGELAQSSGNDEDISAAKIQQNLAATELMEAEVGDLLDVVSSMEEGDLTIEAQVNDRATGLVADTLNRLREKLVEIISSVLGTAQQVAQGASDLEELAQTVVQNTAEQAQSVAQGQALTEQVATIAERSAAQVNVANQSLQEVRDTVASGQTAINTLTDSISVLQTGSAQIVQRMKTLGEFVGLAEQFVQDQGQIASLTQVLALNATLVAARAAEQKDPKQFASVAREFESISGQVNDLATQTNDGLTVLQQRTSQIQTVVTAIDVEVQNLSGLVSGFTSGVESSQAAFNSIQNATEEVVQIGQTITESSTEIANAAGSTASYISEIAQLADRTADLTRSARQQAEAMGNQAQQLLQGIQFFRLPESSALVNPTNQAKTSDAESLADSPDTSVNSLFDSSTESSNTGATSNLGLVVPAIAAATAVTLSQSGQDVQSAYEYELPDDEDNTATDSRYLEDMLDESIDSNLSEINETDSPQVQNLASVSEYLSSEDVPDSQNLASENYSDLTDISLIEESLLADLKHELYDEDEFDNPAEEDLEALDDEHELEPSLKNPMEGVNEFAIAEASGDPIIVSATSSFLEDTAFGSVSPLAEDSNLNLSAFVDFTIPDLDDDDFVIPKMDIESTLDDSNSFFDSTLIQESEVSESSVDFDPFAMDDQPIQSSVESDDFAIADNDTIFESSFASTDRDVSVSEDISEDSISNLFEDYSQFTSADAVNESFEEPLENLSSDAFSDTFDMSFDESPFDRALDEALNDSPDELFTAAEIPSHESLQEATDDEFNYELAEQDGNDGFDLDLPVDSHTNDLESEHQDAVADLPSQIPDIYLAASLDDEFPEEFTFEMDDTPLINDADLDESLSMESSGLILSSPDEQSETDLSLLFNESDESTTEDLDTRFEFDQNLADNLITGQVDELDSIWQTDENISDELDLSDPFDFASIPVSEDLLKASEISIVPETAIAIETSIQEPPVLELSEQQVEDFSEELSEDFSFEIEEDLPNDYPDLTSINELSNDAEAIQDIRDFNDSFASEDDDLDDEFVAEFAIVPESRIQEEVVSNLAESESENDFSTFFNESEDLEEDEFSGQIWQAEEIESDLAVSSDIGEESSEVLTSNATSISSTFDLLDFSQLREPDDALLDEVFNFDISDDDDDFGDLANSLDEESIESIDFTEEILSDSESDISSIFSDSNELEFSDRELLNSNSIVHPLDIDENVATFESLTEGIESDYESIEFSEILDASNPHDHSLDMEESVIFMANANDLNVETSAEVLDLSETDNFGLDSGFTESTSEIPLDFSDTWFDSITNEEDNVKGEFPDLDDDISIGYPSEVADLSDEDSYGFADNLLDSLMDESDEEFDDLSMDLSNLPTSSDLVSNPTVETVETEDIDDALENEFDFSVFDLSTEDSISTARSEIDDFLSGSLDIDDVADESSLKQDENKSISKTDSKLVDPDKSVQP
jgi:methyl-accepting chemotaxis protein PixJ